MPNPLLNDLILSKIFSNLPLSNLLQCRLVCKTWKTNGEINYRLGNETTLYLKGYDRLEKFSTFLDSSEDFSLFRKIELNFTAQCHPLCDSHHIVGEAEERAAKQGKEKLNILLEKLERSEGKVDCLKLTLDKSHLDKEGLEDMLLRNLVFRGLKTLHIYNLSHRAIFSRGFADEGCINIKTLIMDEIRIPVIGFMQQFLARCPSLEDIILKCDKRSDWENQKGIWKEHSPLATSIIQGLSGNCLLSNSPLRLRTLRCGILDLSHFLLLTEMGKRCLLRLNLLEIYCPSKDVCPQVVKDFLETQAMSLKVLRVLGNVEKLRRAVGNRVTNDPNLPPGFVLEIPEVMKKINEFQLSGRDKDTPIPLCPIHFSHQLPYLTTLIINGFANNILEKMSDYFPPLGSTERPCETLRKLVLPAELRDPFFPPRVSAIFPRIVDLDIKYPDNSFLLSLFSNFHGIRRLRILADCNTSIEVGILGLGEIDEGITKLKGTLEELEITVETEHRDVPNSITDRSAYEALGRMVKLRQLVLISCCWLDGPFSCNFFSTNSKQFLQATLQYCVIIFDPGTSSICI